MNASVLTRLPPALALLGAALVAGLAWAAPAAVPSGAPIAPAAVDHCPPLDPPTGPTVTVSTVAQLQDAVNTATSGHTILVADGTYNLNGGGGYLRFTAPDVTLRSASGNRESVVLDGNYVTTEIVQIVASNVTIADLTLRQAYNHPIHVMSSSGGDVTGTLIYNVHIIDPRQQAIKINPYTMQNALYFPDAGVVACSHIELTDAGRTEIRDNCYTGGVDAHQAQDWVIRDNVIEGFWCPTGLSEHGIHLWRSCRGTLVERNTLRNNARGIGFGMATSGSGIRTYDPDPCPGATGYVDHYGGTIRNNVVFANDSGLFGSDDGFDCGICLWNACGARVLHNTVASTETPFSSIEWRYDNTDIDLVNNLVSHNLMDRGGSADRSGNLDGQPLTLFVDGPGGDLHLDGGATVAIDQVTRPADVNDDFDGDVRPLGAASDVGADEYAAAAPAVVTNLRVSRAVTDTTTLTATLTWTPPAEAITATLRYTTALISEGNWSASALLTDTLPGGSGAFTTVVPYSSGDRVYFAHRYQNADGAWSGLSNNAFWPTHDVFLPLVMRSYAGSSSGLIQPSDLTYRGAFRLPDSPDTPDNVGWEWSNWASAAAYAPDGDPGGPSDGYPGSLFGVGHDHTQYVSEIDIPVPVSSPGKDLGDLNTATTLQAFNDIRGGLFGTLEMPRAGLAYLPPQGSQAASKLYFAWAPHLDEGATDPSHGWCELDLTSPQSAGAWRIGDYWNYVTGDYLFAIPQPWADAHASGRRLATGRYRDGGQGAQGPALFAVAPWEEGNPPADGSTLPATPLLLYSAVTDLEQHTMDGYHHADEWTGGAWLTAGGASAVVFVGTKGTGDCWYGCADGTDEPPWPPNCDRGWWSTGFVGRMVFYDPADLAAVAQGELEPYEPQPYAALDVDDYLYHVGSDQQKYHVGAMTFDRERGLLYLLEPLADSNRPLVHVWQVEG